MSNYDSEAIVKSFFRAAESYHTSFGKPSVFCVNRNVFKIVVAHMIKEGLIPSDGDEELDRVTIWDVPFDAAEINSDKYLIGIHSSGIVKRIGM